MRVSVCVYVLFFSPRIKCWLTIYKQYGCFYFFMNLWIFPQNISVRDIFFYLQIA